MKITFFSGSDFALPLLEQLHKNHTVQVVTKPDTELRGKVLSNHLTSFALDHDLPLWQPENLKGVEDSEYQRIFGGYDLAVVVSYGYIIPEKILKLFKYGAINWHPSLLPTYRGPTPVQSALIDNAPIGLTWITMNSKMDEGDILLQTPIETANNDTFDTVIAKAIKLGKKQLATVINAQVKGLSTPQSESEYPVTYTKMLSKDDGVIHPTEYTADQVSRLVRAYSSFPRVYCQDPNLGKCRIDQVSSVVDTTFPHDRPEVFFRHENKTYLKCKDGWLQIQQLTMPNGKMLQFTL